MDLNKLVLLVALLPIAGAAAGYALRRAADAAAYLGIASLLASAGISLTLLAQIQDQPYTFAAGAITLPASVGTPILPADATAEQRAQFVGGIAQYIAEHPVNQQMPLQFSVGRSQLLFTLTTALIAALCLLFALWERRGDPRRGQFYATLALFSGAMLLFLSADTLLLIYLAWELMGLCSFLLIGYPGTARARRAAREAFWTTRATDFGLFFAVLIMMGRWGWMTFSQISVNELLLPLVQQQQQDPAFNALGFATLHIYPWLGAVAILVLFATMGKLAMFPLSFWLPEAMAAPAPVSALLHAATMVAAGPFLLTRMAGFFQYSQAAMTTAVLLGGVSLVLCGLMALAARDAKRVLAYSTISQLSVAVIGVGVLNYNAALYHILAHAWLKAPLFLAVGYLAALASKHTGGTQHVAEHSGDEHDSDDHTLLTRMAGAARGKPLTVATLLLAGASMAGIVGLGGYFGKEGILLALLTRYRHPLDEAGAHTFGTDYPLASAAWTIGSAMLILSIPITAAYATRLVGILGFGRKSGAVPAAAQGAGFANVLALLAAVTGSLGVGMLAHRFTALVTQPGEEWRWPASGASNSLALGIAVLDGLLVLGGITFAWLLNVARPASGSETVEAGSLGPAISFFASGMRLREFWTALVGRTGWLLALLADRSEERVIARAVEGAGHDGRCLAHASAWFEQHVVDGLRYWGAEVWWVVRRWHQRLLQTGSIQHYMFVIVAAAVFLCFVILRPLAKAFGQILGRM